MAFGNSRLQRYRSMNTSETPRNGVQKNGMNDKTNKVKDPKIIIHKKSAVRLSKGPFSSRTPYLAIIRRRIPKLIEKPPRKNKFVISLQTWKCLNTNSGIKAMWIGASKPSCARVVARRHKVP